jgi:hypothetical protein
VESTLRSGHTSPESPKTRTDCFVVVLVIALVAVGAALRIWQYAANTSLWLDEIALAKGVLDFDLSHLLISQLPYDQVAPKGFLLVEKVAVLALGTNDYALRLFPFVFSLISLAVFGRLAIRMLDGAGSVAATLLFATAAPMVAFGAVVKQYSSDVCIAVLLWWLAYEVVSRPVTATRARITALIGAILVWFSQPGVLMLVALGACLLWLAHSSGGRLRHTVLIVACWVPSALAAAVVGFASMSQTGREYVQRFWVGGFPPGSLSRELDTLWPWDQLRLLFGSGEGAQAGLAYPLPILYALLSAIGLGILWRRNHKAAALLIAPLIVTLGAAVARQYPFSDRLIVFLVPSFLLAIGAAIDAVYRICARISKPLGAFIAVALLAPGVYPIAISPPPYRTEDVKPVLSYVRDRWQPSDSVYIYYGAAPATAFYAARYGFNRGDYAIGGCHRGDSRRYLRELDTSRGRSRVWLLLTHSLPYYREREDILSYLDAIGARRDELVVQSYAVGRNPRPVEAYLYDLSDAGRLANGAADSFPLTGPSSALQGFGCEAAAQAMIPSDFR